MDALIFAKRIWDLLNGIKTKPTDAIAKAAVDRRFAPDPQETPDMMLPREVPKRPTWLGLEELDD